MTIVIKVFVSSETFFNKHENIINKDMKIGPNNIPQTRNYTYFHTPLIKYDHSHKGFCQ